ncbi:MAG: hypothetical protein ACHREM_10380 [Polyangiales bacterium]
MNNPSKTPWTSVRGRVPLAALTVALASGCAARVEHSTDEGQATRRTEALTLVGPADDAWGAAFVDTTPTAHGSASNGGTPVVTMVATGWYHVDFPGIEGSGGNVQLSTMSPYAHCTTLAWYPESVPITSANPIGVVLRTTIACVDLTSAPTNASYYVLYQRHSHAMPAGSAAVMAWDDLSTTSGPTNRTYAWNSSGGSVTSTRTAAGTYSLLLGAGVGGYGVGTPNGGMAFVTAYGTTAAWCSVTQLSTVGANISAGVACYDHTGAVVDSQFTFLFVQNSAPILGLSGGYALMNTATGPGFFPPPAGNAHFYSTGSSGLKYSLQLSNGYADFIGLTPPTSSPLTVDPGRVLVLAGAYGTTTNYCLGSAMVATAAPAGTTIEGFCLAPTGSKVTTVGSMSAGLAIVSP